VKGQMTKSPDNTKLIKIAKAMASGMELQKNCTK